MKPILALALLSLVACRATTSDWADVTGGEWTVVDEAAAPATLTFEDDGRLSGVALNRFFADFERTGDALRLGVVGATRMAGPPEAMAAESELFERLAAVTGWRVAGERLELLGEGGVVLTLER